VLHRNNNTNNSRSIEMNRAHNDHHRRFATVICCAEFVLRVVVLTRDGAVM
jgi:hypothetical protein